MPIADEVPTGSGLFRGFICKSNDPAICHCRGSFCPPLVQRVQRMCESARRLTTVDDLDENERVVSDVLYGIMNEGALHGCLHACYTDRQWLAQCNQRAGIRDDCSGDEAQSVVRLGKVLWTIWLCGMPGTLRVEANHILDNLNHAVKVCDDIEAHVRSCPLC